MEFWGLAHLGGTTKAVAPPFAVFERWGSRTYGLGLDVESQGIGIRAPHPTKIALGGASSCVLVFGRITQKAGQLRLGAFCSATIHLALLTVRDPCGRP
jgi:hypothetical protein